jgi:hypothetical protein
MSNIQTLQRDIEELAISWGEALKIGDYRKANKQNSAVTRLTREFINDKKLGEAVLIPLLRHPSPSVRLLASVHALDLGIHTQESEDTLISIAGDPSIRAIRLMAQINLSEWNKKKRATSNNQKDEQAD